MTVRVHFTVDVDYVLDQTEFIMVCGSTAELGSWIPQDSLALAPHPDIPGRWKGHIDTSDTVVKYRYFIGYKLFGDRERLIVAQWESHLSPRTVYIKAKSDGGEMRVKHVDLFEYFAGTRSAREGWLQYPEENLILLSIHGEALKFYKKSERKNCRIKATSVDVRQNMMSEWPASGEDEEEEENIDPLPSNLSAHSDTTVSVLSSTSSNCKYQRQRPMGIVFNNFEDYLVFKTRSIAVEFLAFHVEIFLEDGKKVGGCYALPSSLSDSSGQTSLPFLNAVGRPIGQITVEYLFIRSLRSSIPRPTMEVTFCSHWKKRNTLEVGHRGAGNSYSKFAMARENTIHSLNTAARNGADYVEFDVQLTKDKIAIIYHDFHVLVSVSTRKCTGMDFKNEVKKSTVDFHEMAVKDLKLSQLQLLKMEHVDYPKNHERQVKKLVEEDDEEQDLRPFPTLVDALKNVDADVGFNVEVKYPMVQADGLNECDHYFERNHFVDVIVADVLNNAGGRRIMFSSFDPDICYLFVTSELFLALSMKQNLYPVLFLCVGKTQRYARFKDQRCSTSLAAVNFASAVEILGVNFNSEDLLNEPRPVRRANELGLVSFVWGDDLDNKDHQIYFKKELGVDGLIYDRIGEDERRTNVFVVEREAKKALFLAYSGVPLPQRTSALSSSFGPSEHPASFPPSASPAPSSTPSSAASEGADSVNLSAIKETPEASDSDESLGAPVLPPAVPFPDDSAHDLTAINAHLAQLSFS